MTLSSTPASARTDGAVGTDRRGRRDVPLAAHGIVLAVGAAAWSAASYRYGFDSSSETGTKVADLSGLAFQLGVLALVQLQIRTAATGPGLGARAMLQVERVLLGLAMVWTASHALLPGSREDTWMAVLDVCWPLSMLGMFVIAVKIAFAGRWRGIARFYPLVAESWVLVTIPTLAIFGRTVGDLVGATHLLVGYTTLGVLLALRSDLVRPRG
jgi:hypothetical protein